MKNQFKFIIIYLIGVSFFYLMGNFIYPTVTVTRVKQKVRFWKPEYGKIWYTEKDPHKPWIRYEIIGYYQGVFINYPVNFILSTEGGSSVYTIKTGLKNYLYFEWKDIPNSIKSGMYVIKATNSFNKTVGKSSVFAIVNNSPKRVKHPKSKKK